MNLLHLSKFSSVIIFNLFFTIRSANTQVDRTNVSAILCTSTECINEARTIYEYRNDSAKPCDDFYEFVCGEWTATHPMIPDGMIRNPYYDLTILNLKRIRDILEDTSDFDEPQFVKKTKTFYRSCLDRDEQLSENIEILKQRLKSWGGWPIATETWENENFDWLKLMLHLLKKNGIHPIFGITITADYQNISQPRIAIENADKEFCSFHESKIQEDRIQILIIKTALKIANLTNQNVSAEEVEKEAARLTRLGAHICKLVSETESSLNRLMPVPQMQNLTDSVQPLNNFAKINWFKLLNEFVHGSKAQIVENEQILVTEPDFVPDIVELIDNTPERTLANYMLWRLIQSMEAYEWLGILDEELESEEMHSKNEIVPEEGNSQNKKESEEDSLKDAIKTGKKAERWKTCIIEMREHFQHAFGYQYVNIYFGDKVKKEAEELVKDIHRSFVRDLEKNSWMDEKSRSETVAKAKKLDLLVGYPDWYNTTNLNDCYREYTIGKNHLLNLEEINSISHQDNLNFFDRTKQQVDYWQPIAEANAFNLYPYDIIIIPSALFQAPIFVVGRPAALNYGALGTTIGHEISHSFDSSGTRFRSAGINSWWTVDTLKQFQSKKQCIEEIYSDYPTPELEDEKAWKLDGHKTVGENLADIGGLEIAFSAYKKYLLENGPDQKLPGLTQFTPEQLFFIGYGMAWCEGNTKESLVNTIQNDEHTPERYRVSVNLANSKEFSEAWKCKKGDKMHTDKRCHFWND